MFSRFVRPVLRAMVAGAMLVLLPVPSASAAPPTQTLKTATPTGIGGTCPSYGCTPQLVSSTELVSNGGFEYYSGWLWINPDPWRLSRGAAYVRDSALAHNGTGFLDFGTVDGGATQIFAIPAGTT